MLKGILYTCLAVYLGFLIEAASKWFAYVFMYLSINVFFLATYLQLSSIKKHKWMREGLAEKCKQSGDEVLHYVSVCIFRFSMMSQNKMMANLLTWWVVWYIYFC